MPPKPKERMEKVYNKLKEDVVSKYTQLEADGIYLRGISIDPEIKNPSVGGLYRDLITHTKDVSNGRKDSELP